MTVQSGDSPSRDQGKQNERLLKAASEVFLELGYSAASIDEAAARAKASKLTFYKHFGNKEALFEAVVRHRIRLINNQLFTSFESTEELRPWLEQFAHLLALILFAEENIAFLRMLHAESRRFPKLVESYEREGPRVALRKIAQYLEEQMLKGNLRSASPQAAAEHFFHLTLGEIGRRSLLDVRPRFSTKEVDERLKDGVDVFWRAYATNTPASVGRSTRAKPSGRALSSKPRVSPPGSS